MYLGATSPAVKHRQAIEKRIVLSLIDELLACTFLLSVDDGDGETTKPTSDRAVIVDAIMNTDEDYLIVSNDAGRFGWVRLVYGNDGWDVISDNTVNLEPFIQRTTALAKELEG